MLALTDALKVTLLARLRVESRMVIKAATLMKIMLDGGFSRVASAMKIEDQVLDV